MTAYETLDISRDKRGVTYVQLNLPEKRNALSAVMIAELTDMAATLGAEEDCRAIVLSGRGRVFCAGGDLEWMHAQINADRATRITEATKLAMMLQTLNGMPTPLIGRIHGGAFGGGVGLACVCDVAIADSATKFGLTETRLGLIPATIGPYVLARMGEGLARRVFMSARVFGAEEAADLKIIKSAVPEDALDAAIEHEVAPYLQVAPQAVAASKALARALGPKINQTVIDETIQRLADTWEGEEARHGIAAFLEKKPARWVQ